MTDYDQNSLFVINAFYLGLIVVGFIIGYYLSNNKKDDNVMWWPIAGSLIGVVLSFIFWYAGGKDMAV